MGVFDKIKNLFIEEEEIEVPIKKEVKHVEIAPPKREIEPQRQVEEEKEVIRREVKEEKVEPKREYVADSTALNREERFKFPVYFTDEDFEDLPKKEEVKKVEAKKPVQPKVEPYKPIVEEKKSFKPSPIISPVYGVLDKNYKKEDISAKKDRPLRRHISDEKLTVDDIRNKAYGTLEDDLEKALVMDPVPTYEEKEEATIDIFEELENSKRNKKQEETVDLTEELERQKQKIEEINAFIKQNTVVKEEKNEEQEIVNEDKKEESLEETVELMVEQKDLEETKSLEPIIISEPKKEVEEQEEIDNGDLFNLIDSMYEKRDEE